MRWLFADQLGPHFLDDWDGPVLFIESAAVLRRRATELGAAAPRPTAKHWRR